MTSLSRPNARDDSRSGWGSAALGVLVLLLAGLVAGGSSHSNDPELVLAATFALTGCGLLGVIVGGIELGLRAARR